jgi:hypothetical protein
MFCRSSGAKKLRNGVPASRAKCSVASRKGRSSAAHQDDEREDHIEYAARILGKLIGRRNADPGEQ